jgi:hypothetical protein
MIEVRFVYPDSEVPESPKNAARNQLREIDCFFRGVRAGFFGEKEAP